MAKRRKTRNLPEQQAVAPTVVSVTIPAGQSMSDVADISAKRLWRVRMPAGWTTPQGGRPIITFQISVDNLTWRDLCNRDGTEMTAHVVLNGSAPIQTDLGEGIVNTYIKIRSGLRDSPVVQAADRVFGFVIG